jgi:hypothetical protein
MRVIERDALTAREELASEELSLLSNALNEILRGPDSISAEEFQTRTGFTRDSAGALRRELGEAVQNQN